MAVEAGEPTLLLDVDHFNQWARCMTSQRWNLLDVPIAGGTAAMP